METFNLHIKGIAEHIARYYEEISKSASASVTALSSADKRRLNSYLTQLREYVDWIFALQSDDDGGFLDLPESHPRARAIEALPAEAVVENNHLRDVLDYLTTLHEEVVNCQSSRLAAGLLGADYDRCVALLDVLDSYIASFIENNSPMDMPESSPRTDQVATGRKGVRKS